MRYWGENQENDDKNIYLLLLVLLWNLVISASKQLEQGSI